MRRARLEVERPEPGTRSILSGRHVEERSSIDWRQVLQVGAVAGESFGRASGGGYAPDVVFGQRLRAARVVDPPAVVRPGGEVVMISVFAGVDLTGVPASAVGDEERIAMVSEIHELT